MNKARRHSFNEGDGLKLKRLNVLYPNTFVKQHQLDKIREHERKKMERLALQLRKKNTILSSCQKQLEVNFRPCQRQLILHNHEIKIQSLSSKHTSYEGIKQIFQRKQFVESKYKVDKLITSPLSNAEKENLCNIYNLRPNKVINKLIDSEIQRKSIVQQFKMLSKIGKSNSTHHSVKSILI
ncbi:unnamed protein product [Paramecium sonneborni]|uniref:Uncharacterized protein n=1 Tax=Paramecium sonneborni TaxID=65129 RepID=A0A8S1L3L9_9CILI|nr:unnamed protein product [Paramecium sonneborni]